MRTSSTSAFWIVSLVCFASGATGLTYEVVWFKQFTHVWGSSETAMAAVVGSFLLGLALGAHFLGRLSDRTARPLFWYGLAEAAAGTLALAVPYQISWAIEHLAAVPLATFESYPHLVFFWRAFTTFLIIGPPCVFMGASLPLLSAFSSRLGHADGSIAWLYGGNTLGAAVGCYAAGFHLLPAVGLFWTNFLAGVFNIAIGTVGMVLGTRFRQVRWSPQRNAVALAGQASVVGQTPPICSRIGVSLAAGMTGLAALVLQMVWLRQLALIVGASTYAFSACLFVILAGIALGSMLLGRLVRSFRGRDEYLIAALILMMGAGLIAGQMTIPALSLFFGSLRQYRGAYLMNALLCVFAACSLGLVSSLGMGALLPLLIRRFHQGTGAVGGALGTIYATNMAGSILGAGITSRFLIPWLGFSKTLAAALAAYFVVAIAFLPFADWKSRARVLLYTVMSAGLVVFCASEEDPRKTNLGMYLYGREVAVQANATVLHFKEGENCSVLVLTEVSGGRTLRINGKVDASDQGDMSMQAGSAYFARFFRPTAQNVLVIGFGSGTTSGCSLQFPHTSVRCCELEPAVFAASHCFSHVNHEPERSPLFSVVFDDARGYLQAHGQQKYDLILSEPSNPWIAGVSNLFTKEFYELARQRMTDSGLLAQWVQGYDLSPVEYAIVLRTVKSVFPNCGLVRVTKFDTVVLASMAPLAPTGEELDRIQADIERTPAIKDDLNRYFGTVDVRSLLLSHFFFDEARFGRLLDMDRGSTLINTDNNLKLEFEAANRLFLENPHLDANLVAALDPQIFVDWFDRWKCTAQHVPALQTAIVLFITSGNLKAAERLSSLALDYDPQNPPAVASHLFCLGMQRRPVTGKYLEYISAKHAGLTNGLGIQLLQLDAPEAARDVFTQLISDHNDAALYWANLALSQCLLGSRTAAQRAFERAIALDPQNQRTIEAYSKFRASFGLPGLDASKAKGAGAGPE